MIEFALGYILATMIYAIIEVVSNKGKINKDDWTYENKDQLQKK